MNLTLKIWRQKDAKSKGKFVTYKMADVSPEMSFLEMLDVLNDNLVRKNEDELRKSKHFSDQILKEIKGKLEAFHLSLGLKE